MQNHAFLFISHTKNIFSQIDQEKRIIEQYNEYTKIEIYHAQIQKFIITFAKFIHNVTKYLC